MDKIDKKLCYLLVFLFLFLLGLSLFSPTLLWDENAYLSNARAHVATSKYTEDFRFPLLELLIAGLWLITGESAIAARLLVISLALGCAALTYLISRRLFSENGAFVITTIFALSPLFILWSWKVYTDVPALFFVLLSTYFLIKGERKSTYTFIALAGLSAAAAFLLRFPTGLFGLAAGVLLLARKEYRKFFVFALVLLAALLPWLLYNLNTYHDPLWDLKVQYSIVQTYAQHEPVTKGLLNLFTATGALALALPFGIWSFLRRKNKEKENLRGLILLYSGLLLVYFLFLVPIKLWRYYVIGLPFLFILAYRGLLWVKEKWKVKTVILALIVLLSVALSFGLILASIAKDARCCNQGAIVAAIKYLKPKVIENDTVLSNAWPFFGYGLNVRATSLWTENVIVLVQRYSPKFFVYSETRGMLYNKSLLDRSKRLEIETQLMGICGERVFIYSVKY